MPKYGADGDVIDVALTTVKIQNWDKTITQFPLMLWLAMLLNWRGMSESRGRRIKRSIFLDLSVRFLKETEIAELEKIELKKDYFSGKREEIAREE